MPDFDPKTRELLTAMLLMAGLLVLIALGIQVINVYRRRLTVRSADEKAELAESFREAYESGEISTDEYRHIKDALDRDQPPPPLRRLPLGAETPPDRATGWAEPGPLSDEPPPPPPQSGGEPRAEGGPPARPGETGRGQ